MQASERQIVSAILVNSHLLVAFDNGESAYYPAFFLYASLPLMQAFVEQAEADPQ